MRNSRSILIGALALLAVPAFADDNPARRDLTVEQTAAAQAGKPRPGSLRVQVAADRADATYVVGETVRLTVSANEESYVTVFDVGPTGQTTQLFPNRFQTNNHLLANRPVEIAGPKSGARLKAAGPVGVELIKVVASSKPIAVVTEAQLQGQGPFRSVEGGSKAISRDLEVVSDQAERTDTKIDFFNFTLQTVGARLTAAPAPATAASAPAAPAMAPQAPNNLISIPMNQPFALLVALDKPVYRNGDDVTLAVTPMRACNLTVLDVAASGSVRTLFPNETTPKGAVAQQQTVFVAGGPSGNKFAVSGPAGTEQIIAVCVAGDDPVKQLAASDRSALSRDLDVVAEHPAGATAMAAVTFSVRP